MRLGITYSQLGKNHWTTFHLLLKASSHQHVKQALIQASFYWSQALAVRQNIPNFSEWGWNKDSRNKWQPLWTSPSDAS